MGPRGFTLFRPPDSVKWCWYLQVVTQPVEDRCLRWSFRRNEWHLLGGYVYKYTIALLITIDDKLVLLKCSNRGRSVQWLCLWISPLRGWAVKQHLQYTTLTAQTVEEPWILTPNYFWPVQSVGKKGDEIDTNVLDRKRKLTCKEWGRFTLAALQTPPEVLEAARSEVDLPWIDTKAMQHLLNCI